MGLRHGGGLSPPKRRDVQRLGGRAYCACPRTCPAIQEVDTQGTTRSSISAPCWPRSPTIPSAASRNSCPGILPCPFRLNPPKPLRHTLQVPTKKVVGTSRDDSSAKSRGELRTLTNQLPLQAHLALDKSAV